MSNYKFTQTKRYAVYLTHGEKCYMCSKPIDLQSMHIDHILPEELLKNPNKLKSILTQFGLPIDFNINSYENWMPSCSSCNLKKSYMIFNPTPIIQIELQKAREKAEHAKFLEEKLVHRSKVTKALNLLKRANEQGKLNREIIIEMESLVEFHKQVRNIELSGEPIKLTPLYEILSESNGILTIKGPYGIGGRPSSLYADSSFNCANCGSAGAWNGAKCVICGQMED